MDSPAEADVVWMDGKLVPWADATVHILTHSLHHGTAVLEGTRVHRSANGPVVFRLEEHVDRLIRSARILRMDLPFTRDELIAGTLELVRANAHDACYVRHLAYHGAGPMSVVPDGNPVRVAIASWEWGAYLGDHAVRHGARLMTSSWRRNDPNALPPEVKATGPYLNAALAKREALDAGYDEALMLGADGQVGECSSENIFAMLDGTLVTPPVSSGILAGLTRDSVLCAAADLGIPTAESPMTRTMLYTAEEVFLTGTAAQLTPVSSIDGRELARVGETTGRLDAHLTGIVRGELPDTRGWLTFVDPPEAG